MYSICFSAHYLTSLKSTLTYLTLIIYVYNTDCNIISLLTAGHLVLTQRENFMIILQYIACMQMYTALDEYTGCSQRLDNSSSNPT